MYRRLENVYYASEIAAFLHLPLNGPDTELYHVSEFDHVRDYSLVLVPEDADPQEVRERVYGHHDLLLLCAVEMPPLDGVASIVSPDPALDFVKILKYFIVRFEGGGIHPTACVEEGAEIGADVSIGAHAWCGPDVRIGDRCTILQNVVISGPVRIGSDCVIKANSTIGSEGFRFIPDHQRLEHIPQIGGIRIGNRVWIGSNVAIERGSLKETVIDDEAKIDDLVQIGYDARIGRAAQITAGTVVGGNAVIEARCWVAPNSSIDVGVVVGRDSVVGMGSVIRRSVDPGSVVAGVPGRLLRKRQHLPKEEE